MIHLLIRIRKNFSTIFFIFIACVVLSGCGKSDKFEDKNIPQKRLKRAEELIKSSKFYECSDLKYWQNYPGICPDNNDVDLEWVKNSDKMEKIKNSLIGLSGEEVYICETDQGFVSNHPGKCPRCSAEMIKLNDLSTVEAKKKLEEIKYQLKDSLNIVQANISVPSAKCEQCGKLIELALIKDKGIKNAFVDTDIQKAYIFFDSIKTGKDKIITLINSAGFKADDKPGNSESLQYLPECCK